MFALFVKLSRVLAGINSDCAGMWARCRSVLSEAWAIFSHCHGCCLRVPSLCAAGDQNDPTGFGSYVIRGKDLTNVFRKAVKHGYRNSTFPLHFWLKSIWSVIAACSQYECWSNKLVMLQDGGPLSGWLFSRICFLRNGDKEQQSMQSNNKKNTEL